MILAVDVAYRGGNAAVGGILFQQWDDDAPVREITAHVPSVKAYVPGRFYQRELPCIFRLLEDVSEPVETIIIDAYAYLGKKQRAGLGTYLYCALFGQISVIGVAKTKFGDVPARTEVYRGASKRPLYVTSVGMDERIARKRIADMAGTHRIPILLKRVDTLCRGLEHGKKT
ncbi:MAG: endonuclease V [Desulfosalsimonadaceae bacterium]